MTQKVNIKSILGWKKVEKQNETCKHLCTLSLIDKVFVILSPIFDFFLVC